MQGKIDCETVENRIKQEQVLKEEDEFTFKYFMSECECVGSASRGRLFVLEVRIWGSPDLSSIQR